jgi:hypothetical protein
VALRRDNIYMSPDVYLRMLGQQDWIVASPDICSGARKLFLTPSNFRRIATARLQSQWMTSCTAGPYKPLAELVAAVADAYLISVNFSRSPTILGKWQGARMHGEAKCSRRSKTARA